MDQELQAICEQVVDSWKKHAGGEGLDSYIQSVLSLKLEEDVRGLVSNQIEGAVRQQVNASMQGQMKSVDAEVVRQVKEWSTAERKALIQRMVTEQVVRSVEPLIYREVARLFGRLVSPTVIDQTTKQIVKTIRPKPAANRRAA